MGKNFLGFAGTGCIGQGQAVVAVLINMELAGNACAVQSLCIPEALYGADQLVSKSGPYKGGGSVGVDLLHRALAGHGLIGWVGAAEFRSLGDLPEVLEAVSALMACPRDFAWVVEVTVPSGESTCSTT